MTTTMKNKDAMLDEGMYCRQTELTGKAERPLRTGRVRKVITSLGLTVIPYIFFGSSIGIGCR